MTTEYARGMNEAADYAERLASMLIIEMTRQTPRTANSNDRYVMDQCKQTIANVVGRMVKEMREMAK